MELRPLGKLDLRLTLRGIHVRDDGTFTARDGSNWCDIPANLNAQAWQSLAAHLSPDFIVQARVGPAAWGRPMLDACQSLLIATGLQRIDLWQLAAFDQERIKGGEPGQMMMKLRDRGQVRYFSVRVSQPKDAMWLLERFPLHSLTIEAHGEGIENWREALAIAKEDAIGILLAPSSESSPSPLTNGACFSSPLAKGGPRGVTEDAPTFHIEKLLAEGLITAIAG